MQSYYGGLLCCAWSPDGRHLAAGGEDDQVALYSVADRETVAWGEAHGSWVSALAFDPWRAPSLMAEHITPILVLSDTRCTAYPWQAQNRLL